MTMTPELQHVSDSNETEFETEEIHAILSNDRRRLALKFLQAADDGTMTVGDLSEIIASVETDDDPPPRDARKSVYVTLHQNHLPRLHDLGVVEYDASSKEVTLRDQADEITVYMDVVPEYDVSWADFYLAIGLVGVLLTIAAHVGVPAIQSLGVTVVAVVLFGLLAAVSAVHAYTHWEQTFSYRLLLSE